MTTKTLIRNLKRLEKVMVWMLDLPVEHDEEAARVIAVSDKKVVVCFDTWLDIYGHGCVCGCVGGLYEYKTKRDHAADFYTFLPVYDVFLQRQGRGDTVRSRLAIVRKLIKKMEREDERSCSVSLQSLPIL